MFVYIASARGAQKLDDIEVFLHTRAWLAQRKQRERGPGRHNRKLTGQRTPNMNIRFVDTTLRDGQMSLWATQMKTGMILPIGEQLDDAGFDAIELMSSVFLKKCVRDLKEDPWERIRLVSKKIKNTPLRLTAGRFNAFEVTPHSVYLLYMERNRANGMRQARISDEWNDLSGWQRKVRVANQVGLEPIINIIYSVSPKHTDEYYIERVRQAATLDVSRLCLKDPGGLITPERVRTLVPLVLEHAKVIPVEFHTHCTTGLGPLCCLEAIKLGIRIVNTAIPPLANGSSNPSFFNVANNARALGYTTDVNEKAAMVVSRHFSSIAEQYGFPKGEPVEYDYGQYLHQVPGGMISNLRHQLERVGQGDKLAQALEECGRVREEFAYPIMVTPLSQFVGSQAAINVIVGERYKEVTDQTIFYALGLWGEEGSRLMEPNVKDRILSRPRARELARWEPPEPSVEEVREKMGGKGVSDDDLLLRWLVTEEEFSVMRAAGPPRDYAGGNPSLLALLENLCKRKTSHVRFQKPGLSVTLQRREGVSG